MKTDELIEFYLEKKLAGSMDLSQIRKALNSEHELSDDNISIVAAAISELELEALNNQPSIIAKLTSSFYYSIIFAAFSIVVIIVSIIALRREVPTVFGKTLPWIVLFGGIFLLVKHISKIINRNK